MRRSRKRGQSMRKAILVIDMPEACEECSLADCDKSRGNVAICRGCGKHNYTVEIRPSWCPLVQMPEKKRQSGIDCMYTIGEKHGWNACVDVIAGVTN